MDVRVVSSTTVNGGRPPDGTTTVPMTIFDKLAADMHVAVLFAFAAPTATNTEIKNGLEKTLANFYTFAGQLGVDERRRPCIILGGGALVVEAEVDSELSEKIPFIPSPELQKLHPPTEGLATALQVQLNRFTCSGLVIGVTCHHRVADGQSMSTFYAAWGRSVKGFAIDRLPIYDIRRWLQPRRPPRSCGEFALAASSHLPPPSGNEGVHNVSLRFSSEFIVNGLKARMTEKYTTFESLLGHLWRKITAARGLAAGEMTEVRVAVDGRRRLNPPVPAEFIGNMVANARQRARARELVEEGIEGAARRIRAAIRRTGEEFFRSVVDFGELHKDGEELRVEGEKETALYPDLEVNSWLGLRFDEVELGGGGACAFAPSWITAEGVVVFFPSRERDGGVDVIVTLFESHANLLRKISHSID